MTKFLATAVALMLFTGSAFAASVATTKEQQLQGCPAFIEVLPVTNSSNAVFAVHLTRACRVAINGDQRDSDGADDSDSN